ncbi:MAG: hypothetical protein E7058_00430 [Lentisphaerae bacterium]|nr:hypothetical protein [Lentisphaerota bacterium]
MENSNITVNVNEQKKKSNAAWICGLVGFITSLPNTLCALICAGATAAVAEEAAKMEAVEKGATDLEAVKAAEAAAAGGVAGYFWFIVLVSILCFALSFMGKGKHSLITGIVVLLGGIFILINGFVGFGSMLWGTATGGLYIASGIVAILNKKRDK